MRSFLLVVRGRKINFRLTTVLLLPPEKGERRGERKYVVLYCTVHEKAIFFLVSAAAYVGTERLLHAKWPLLVRGTRRTRERRRRKEAGIAFELEIFARHDVLFLAPFFLLPGNKPAISPIFLGGGDIFYSF